MCLFALADLDRVLLVQPSEGRLVLDIPLLDRVNDATSPEPGTVCAFVADQVMVAEVAPCSRPRRTVVNAGRKLALARTV